LIAGHRFEAARNCGHQTIRAKVYDSLSDDEAELIQIDENLIRATSATPSAYCTSLAGRNSTRSYIPKRSTARRPEIGRGQIKFSK
jgi:ParB-like chromosome segregation protein Spo0J